jgi:hypothetical protein
MEGCNIPQSPAPTPQHQHQHQQEQAILPTPNDSVPSYYYQQRHPHHIGKKPPPINIKGKNTKRKPRPLKAAAVEKAAGKTGLFGGKRGGRLTKQRSFSRQLSNVDRRFSRTVPRLIITNDEEPDRLTNPLLAMVPESSKRTVASGGSFASSPSGFDSNNNNNIPSLSATAVTTTTKRAIIPAAELMNSASIVFHRPDTYPISYLARVLGFDVDVPDMRVLLRRGVETVEDTKDGASTLPPFPTPIPDPQTLSFRKDSVFFQIPKLGTYFEQYKLQTLVDQTSGLGDRDDQQTLDYIDPLYKALLQHGWNAKRAKPLTSGAASKFVQQQQLQQPHRLMITEMAREMLNMSDDWTFQDWASYSQAQEQKQQQQQEVADSTSMTTCTPKVKGGGSEQDAPATVGFSRSNSYRRRSNVGSMWTIDGKQVFSHIPSHIFGILACYKGEPAALLKYQFQWYYLPTSETKNDYQEENYQADPSQAVEAELMMVVNGFGHPVKEQNSGERTDEVSVDHRKVVAVGLEQQDSAKVETNLGRGGGDQPRITLNLVAAKLDDTVKMIMLSLALEHTRACDVWYGVWDVPVALSEQTKKLFRMVHLPSTNSVTTPSEPEADRCDAVVRTILTSESIPMICDLKKCSSRYAILAMRDKFKESFSPKQNESPKEDLLGGDVCTPRRWLVNFPSTEIAQNFFRNPKSSAKVDERVGTRNHEGKSEAYTSANGAARNAVVRLRVELDSSKNVGIFRVTPNGYEKLEMPICVTTNLVSQPKNSDEAKDELKEGTTVGNVGARNVESTVTSNSEADLNDVEWKFLRYFPITTNDCSTLSSGDEVVTELMKKQKELLELETSLEPMARRILAKVVEERIEYERPGARRIRETCKRILKQNEANVTRRKELDQVWQDQLEQDMNAVCSICDDGEVTPENQILFCESCNVAVHQLCYGIEKVPDGDYYCIACRYYKRDRLMETMSNRQLTVKDASTTSRTALDPLPICCELCPVRQGAYTQSAFHFSSEIKWVHMTCAKWQGLDFVNKNDPSLLEDVTDLKRHFRRLAVSCCICQGKRGAYNKCRQMGCNNWCHVSCARESGLCEVVHGEDVVGYVEENPWTLLCPSHSDRTQDSCEGKKRKATPVEFLVDAAREFPEESLPDPRPDTLKPFNKLTASERKVALSQRSYEDKFFEEILTKKLAGVRCEVCDTVEEDGKNLSRCVGCGCVVCFACQLVEDADMQEQRHFKCYACLTKSSNASNEADSTVRPQCIMCQQKGGLLLAATANPISRRSYWKQNPKELKRSLFGTTCFAHALCAYWSQNVRVNHATCSVNTSNVVLANGRQFVKGKIRCGLCGLKNGLKSRCVNAKCRAHGETKTPYHFHVTCARQAGLEASHNDDPTMGFYGKCRVAASIAPRGRFSPEFRFYSELLCPWIK